jgi:hypothetical protein
VRVKFPLPAPGSSLTTCNTRSAQIGHRKACAEQSLVEPIGRRCTTLMHVPQLQTPETLQPANNSEDAEPSLPTIPLEVFLAAVNGQRSRTELKLCGAAFVSAATARLGDSDYHLLEFCLVNVQQASSPS